jgi:nicotinate dehydrogenase subunit B
VAVSQISVVQGDTARTPDQGATVGSKTLQRGAPAIRQAAADARYTLRLLASVRLSTSVDQLVTRDGMVRVAHEPSRHVSYGELVGGRRFNRPVTRDFQTKSREAYRVVGTSAPRLDIPGKVFGRWDYVHDVRVPGMLHGRVVRPQAVGARVAAVDDAAARSVLGFIQIVRQGDFVGVVCEREEQATWMARCAGRRTRSRLSTAGPSSCTRPSGRPVAWRTCARARRRSGRGARGSSSCGAPSPGSSVSRPSESG